MRRGMLRRLFARLAVVRRRRAPRWARRRGAGDDGTGGGASARAPSPLAATSALRASSVLPNDWGIVKRIRQGSYAAATRTLQAIAEGIALDKAGDTFDVGRLFENHPGMLGAQRPTSTAQFVDDLSQQQHTSRHVAWTAVINMTYMEDDLVSNPELAALHTALWDIESRLQQNVPESLAPTVEAAQRWQTARKYRRTDSERLLTSIEPDVVETLSDEHDASLWSAWLDVFDTLDQDGYLARDENSRWVLGPRGRRVYGRASLATVLADIRARQRAHTRVRTAGERLEQTKPFSAGDTFDPHLSRTLLNAVMRGERAPAIQLRGNDFEVHEQESVTRTATAFVVDYSGSMHHRGAIHAADTLTAALHGLVQMQHTRDEIATFAFAGTVQRVPSGLLTGGGSIDISMGATRLTPAIRAARTWLKRQVVASRHIIVVTDGMLSDTASRRQAIACRREAVVLHVILTTQRDHLSPRLHRALKATGGSVRNVRPADLAAYVAEPYIGRSAGR